MLVVAEAMQADVPKYITRKGVINIQARLYLIILEREIKGLPWKAQILPMVVLGTNPVSLHDDISIFERAHQYI